MTQDQMALLLDLKASHERGAASMSCNQRLTVASELKQQGLVNQMQFGPSFYRINQSGLAVLERKPDDADRYRLVLQQMSDLVQRNHDLYALMYLTLQIMQDVESRELNLS